MRILVTGGAGFIGSTVVDAYVEAGHQVWVIDNESSGTRRQVNPKARFAKIDVRDHGRMRRFFKGKRFDVVNHHAAQIDVRVSVAQPVLDAEVNILSSINLLELCRENRVRKVLFSSSGGTVYGECTRPATEGDPEIPVSPYGVAKLATEKYIKAYAANFGLQYTIFRYANVFGPRQDPHGEAGVVAIFASRLLKGEPISIFGNGRQTRDFVFVRDVAAANVAALRRGRNEVANIGTGRETSVLQLFQEMAKVCGYRGKPAFKPARTGELARSVLSNRHAGRVLGWRPAHTLTEGLRATVRYFEDRSAR